jgi:hypothetical protein
MYSAHAFPICDSNKSQVHKQSFYLVRPFLRDDEWATIA